MNPFSQLAKGRTTAKLWAVSLSVVLIISSSGFAAASSIQTAALSVSPSSGFAGSDVTLTGTGYDPGGYQGTIRWDGVDVDTFFIPEGGAFSLPFTIPGNATAGNHVITICASCDQGEELIQTASTNFNVIIQATTQAPTFTPSPIRTATYTASPIIPLPTSTSTFTATFSATPTRRTLVATPLTATPSRTPLSASSDDIWVNGIEVTQAIQVYPGNQIPLIAYKRTVVRVYVQSVEGRNGPWNDVTARLTVTGGGVTGVVLLPATVSPSASIIVSPNGSNRDILTDSFNFLLPIELTTLGTRDLQVRIYSISGRPESNTTNNSASLSIRFNPGSSAGVYGVNYGNDGTLSSVPRATPAPWTNMEQHRQYAENVMPVSEFFVAPYPGIGTGGRYFTDLEAARAWADLMISRSSLTSTRIYLLQPENTCECGYAAGRRMNGQNNNYASGYGVVMAQEVSHSLGAWWHANSDAHPADMADSNFPYPHSSVGTQVGFNTFAFQPVPSTLGGHTHDYMGYGDSPAWVSPYTYCRMIDLLAGGRFTCPTSARTASEGPFEPGIITAANGGLGGLAVLRSLKQGNFIYVAAWLNGDGTATFEPFYRQTSEDDISTTLQGARYQLRFEDSSGKLLAEYPFEPLASHADERPFLFSLTVSYPENTSRITLNDGEKLLADRMVSPNAPVISQVEVGKGELSGPQILSWKASDADSDPLNFLIEYSPDKGAHWLPLDAYVTNDFATIDFDTLPGGEQALLKVVASDGVNTTEAVVPDTFAVATHGPEIILQQPEDGASFYEMQPFYVSAQAFDWEDGPLQDPESFVWSSNLDGQLATGSWTVLSKLSPGNHTITVSVTDSDGNVSEATVDITILASEVDQIPASTTPIPISPSSETPWLLIGGIAILSLALLIVLIARLRR